MCDIHCSIAMATKENMQSQRGALYAITHRMNFLASILWLFAVCHPVCFSTAVCIVFFRFELKSIFNINYIIQN